MAVVGESHARVGDNHDEHDDYRYVEMDEARRITGKSQATIYRWAREERVVKSADNGTVLYGIQDADVLSVGT